MGLDLLPALQDNFREGIRFAGNWWLLSQVQPSFQCPLIPACPLCPSCPDCVCKLTQPAPPCVPPGAFKPVEVPSGRASEYCFELSILLGLQCLQFLIGVGVGYCLGKGSRLVIKDDGDVARLALAQFDLIRK